MTNETELYQETLSLYREQGLKFTMDELSTRLCISKKTLYEMVASKEALICKLITHYFDLVDQAQDRIHADRSLTSVERLRQLLCASPALEIRRYHLRELKVKYPAAFQLLDEKLTKGWERTFSVIDQAKAEGFINPDLDNLMFSKIYAKLIEELVTETDINSDLSFRHEQQQLVDILLFGICTPLERK